ncbi:MAG: hypothetical protein KMY55_07330 [Dethiosulfatibacter sp.]|nr:hypothetical protein [Dethiosulfatibacter sp.]
MNYKKWISLLLIVALLFISGCSDKGSESTEATSENQNNPTTALEVSYPKKGTTANFYIGGSIAAGGDLNMRTLIRYLQPEMGITIVPNNLTGSRTIYNSGREVMRNPPDGYSFSYVLYPNFITEIYNPSIETFSTTDDLYMLCNLVTDASVIAVRSDDKRFESINDFADFVEYLKNNTNENLLISAASVAGDDDITIRKIKHSVPEIADQLTIVNGEGPAEGLTSLLGKHLDVFTGNVGDITSLVADKKVKVITVFHTKRSLFLPDVKTAEESGYKIYNSSSRGVAIHKDTDPEIIKRIEDYVTKVVNDPVFIDDMARQGYELDYLPHDQYVEFLQKEAKNFEEIMYMYKWGPNKTKLP